MTLYTDRYGTMTAFRLGITVSYDGIMMSCRAILAHTAQAHTLIMAVNIRPIWNAAV